MSARSFCLFLFAALVVVGSSPASADEKFGLDWYHPSGFENGTLVTNTSTTVQPRDLVLGFTYMLSDDTAKIYDPAQGIYYPLVEQSHAASLQVSVGLLKGLSLSASLPFTMARTATDLSGSGLGDMELSGKITFLRGDRDALGLSIVPFATIPSGSQDEWLGWGSATGGGQLVIDRVLGPVMLAANAGFHYRPKRTFLGTSVGSMAITGAAFEWRILERYVSLLIEGRAGADLEDMDKSSPLEALSGVRLRLGGFQLMAGGAFGALETVGTPDYRFIARFGYDIGVGGSAKADRDGDGLADGDDACPDAAEDHDGVLDSDGCPDPDDDGDGVADVNDACKELPEDHDGFEDEDGCPDPDNDNDDIADLIDQCPNQAEVANGYQDVDGCPDEKPTAVAAVDEPKAVASPVEEPAVEEPVVAEPAVEIPDATPLLFDYADDTLSSAALRALRALAKALRQDPRLRVMVEGHASSEGSDDINMMLSRKRAKAVIHNLVSRGIARHRLKFQAFGEHRPAFSNDTASGRAKNRRVEYRVTR